MKDCLMLFGKHSVFVQNRVVIYDKLLHQQIHVENILKYAIRLIKIFIVAS